MPFQRRRAGWAMVGLAVFALCGAGLGSPAWGAPPADGDDWEVRRSPFAPQIVARYKGMLERNPYDGLALRKLVELSRQKGNLSSLVDEYRRKAQAAPQRAGLAVIVGHLEKRRGQLQDALSWYERAQKSAPSDARIAVEIGNALRGLRRPQDARQSYEKALKLTARVGDRKILLKALGELALDLKDPEGARNYFAERVKLEPKNLSLRLEFAVLLRRNNKLREAREEYERILPHTGSDPQSRADILKSIGELDAELGEPQKAIARYKQAMSLASQGYYLRKELTERIIAIHRKSESLHALIKEYESTWKARGHFEWETLARLYEEVGDEEKALAAFRKAAAAQPQAVETRVRLIALLERTGRSSEVLREYERLVSLAPGEAKFQLALAELYYRRGEKPKALGMLARLSARFPLDAGVHSALAELYQRWGDPEKALAEAQILARIEPDDEGHIISLGEQYFQKGQKDRAIATWKRLLNRTSPGGRKDKAFAQLAEVYGDHELHTRALDLWQKAIAMAPKDASHRKGLATLLERIRRYEDAVTEWQQVLTLSTEKAPRREARERIIGIWHLTHRLTLKLPEYVRRFQHRPPDQEAGYFVGEAQLKLGQREQAEATFRRLAELAPRDPEPLLALEGVLRARRKYKEAISVLEHLAKLVPKRAREFYVRMAELLLMLYRDDDAVSFAQKAVALNPEDAQAHARLAEIFEKKQDLDAAIASYKRALELDPRLFRVHFALARLHEMTGSVAEAEKLYRALVKRAPEEEVVLKAARAAIALAEVQGSLGDLERDLAPLVFSPTPKPVYRKLLVELYERYVPPLVRQLRTGTAAARAKARIELSRLGERGLKPLLEALGDADPGQREVAIGVLGFLGNGNAGLPLVELADGRALENATGADAFRLRVSAMVAAGMLGDPRTVPALIRALGDREVALREAAVWALGRVRDGRAGAALLKALTAPQPTQQVYACIGLGRQRDAKLLKPVLAVANDAQRPAQTRAACAWAAGALGDKQAVEPLLRLLTLGSDDLQVKAAWALGALGDARAVPALIAAVWTKTQAVRNASLTALDRLSRPVVSTAAAELPEVPVEMQLALSRLTPIKEVALADPRSILGNGTELIAILGGVLNRHRDLMLQVLADLDARPSGLALGPFTAHLDAAAEKDIHALLQRAVQPLLPRLLELGSHPDPEVRRHALSVLGKSGDARALEILEKSATEARETTIRLAALVALGRQHSPRSQAALVRALRRLGWYERLITVRTLGELGQPQSLVALKTVLNDDNGFIREAAVEALGKLGLARAAQAAENAIHDPVPEVRSAAARSFGRLLGVAGPESRRALHKLARDPNASVRQEAHRALSRPR